MNVPLGILAIVAIIVLMRLPRPDRDEKPRIDALGMALLAIATTGVVLIGTWAGSTYAWASPQILTLAAGTIVAGILVCEGASAKKLSLVKEAGSIGREKWTCGR